MSKRKAGPNSGCTKLAKLIGFASNERYSDITFIVGPEDEPSHQQVFNGHKVLFAATSPVFEAMFNSDIPIQNNQIKITDISPRIFFVFMKILYHPTLGKKTLEMVAPDFEFQDLVELAYVARKYLVENLVQACLRKAKKVICSPGHETLTTDNALTVWELLNAYVPDCYVTKLVNNYVNNNAITVMKTDEFWQLENASLTLFLKSDFLRVGTEMMLFDSVYKWAKKKHRLESEKKTPDSSKRLREIMGPAVYQIRFPTMDFYTFSRDERIQVILTSEEIAAIVHFMTMSCKQQKNDLTCDLFNVNSRRHTKDTLERAKHGKLVSKYTRLEEGPDSD